jgi:hypothetical protein
VQSHRIAVLEKLHTAAHSDTLNFWQEPSEKVVHHLLISTFLKSPAPNLTKEAPAAPTEFRGAIVPEPRNRADFHLCSDAKRHARLSLGAMLIYLAQEIDVAPVV